MDFISFISKNWIVILLILSIWVIGVYTGSKFSRIKTLFIKNPFKGNTNSLRDESVSEVDALRYKRDYVIKLVVKDDKEFPFDEVSDFTFRLEDLIKNEISLKENQKIESLQESKEKPTGDDGELVIMQEDFNEMCDPEQYYKS